MHAFHENLALDVTARGHHDGGQLSVGAGR
jgi:hypothetical protein